MLKKTKTILLIEDDKQLIFALKKKFANDKVKIDVTEDGLSALKYFESKTPDLVLLDIVLPKMSGIEVMKKIAKKVRESICIIAFTNYPSNEIKRQLNDLGIFDYIVKANISIQELHTKVMSKLKD